MIAKMTKTKKFNGKVYTLLQEKLKNKADANFSVISWRSRGKYRGARVAKVDGGYAVYVKS